MPKRISMRKGKKGGWWVSVPGRKDTWHQSKADADRQKNAAIRAKKARGQRKRRAKKRRKR